MKRIILGLTLVAALPLLMLVAGLTWVTFIMDSESLRQQVLKQALIHTGRELVVDGDIELDLLPGIGLGMRSVRLAAREGFGPEPMIEIPHAHVSLQILPLLRGDVRLRMIRLESPVFRFGISTDGTTAVADLALRLRQLTGRGFSDGQALAAALGMLAAQGLDVRDGEFHWFDAFHGNTVRLTSIDLKSQRLRHRETGHLRLSGRLEGGWAGNDVDVTLSADVVADFETLDAEMSDVRLVFEQAPTRLSLAIERINARNLAASPEVTASDATLAMAHQDQAYELVAPSARYSYIDAALAADNLSLRGTEVVADGSLRVTDLHGSPRARIEITQGRFKPAQWLIHAGLDMAVVEALAASDSSLTARVELWTDGVRVDSFELSGMSYDLSGRISLVDFSSPQLTAVIRGSRLDLDGLLANSGDIADAGAAALILGPVELLRQVAGRIDIEIDEVAASGIRMREFGMLLQADAEAVRVEYVRAGVSHGALMADGRLQKSVPNAVSGTLEIRDTDVGALLGSLEFADLLEGETSLRLELASHGEDPDAILSNLSGWASITLVDGIAHGIDVGQILRAIREPDAAKVPEQDSTQWPRTRFSRMTATWRIDRGIGDNRDFHLVAPEFHVNGDGRLDMPEAWLDYRLRIRVVRPEAGKDEAADVTFEPFVVPLRVHGPVTDPSISIDMEGLFKDETQGSGEAEPGKMGGHQMTIAGS